MIKIAKSKGIGQIFAIILAVAVVFVGGLYAYNQGWLGQAVQPEVPVDQLNVQTCDSQTTPDLWLTESDTYDSSKSIGMGSYRVWADSGSGYNLVSTADTSPFADLPLKSQWRILALNTTGVDGSTYSYLTQGETDCSSNFAEEQKTYNIGNLTVTIIGADGIAQDTTTGSGNTTLGADSTKEVTINVYADSNEVWSNPQSTVNPAVCFNYTTDIKEIKINGEPSPSVMPTWLSTQSTYETCKLLPFKTILNGETKSFKVQITTTSTGNPAVGSSDIAFMFADADAYVGKDGQPAFGYEDASGTNVGVTTHLTTIAGADGTIYLM